MIEVQAVCRRVACGVLVGGLLLATAPAWAQPGDAKATLTALEQRRLAAINGGDAAGLQATLADDYQHVHSTGRVENRAEFVKGTMARARTTTRGPLTTRIYGDSAVITGPQTNQMAAAAGAAAPAPQPMYVTQVAHRDKAGWRYVNMQATPIGPGGANNVPNDFPGYPPGPARKLTADQQAVIALEARRAKAIADKDFTALGNVLADDYLHVYGGGATGGRDDYLKQVKAAPRVPTRGPLEARIYGDVAILSGSLLNRIEYPDRPGTVLDTYVTQVARKVGGEWKFVSFQITQKRPG